MNNYNPYINNQMYMQELQGMKDRIENQMKSIQQNQIQQIPQQPITQNFQIAPTQNVSELESKYVENIEDVKKIFVIKTGIFVNRDFSTLWVKDTSGNVRTFNTEEVIEMDEKDKEIFELKKQIKSMEEKLNDANEYGNTDVDEPIKTTKPTRVPTTKRGNAK